MASLPLIQGLETKIFGPKAGKAYKIKELRYCIDILQSFRGFKGFRDYTLKRVVVGPASDISIFLAQGEGKNTYQGLNISNGQRDLEVRLDQGRRLKDKMRILSALLSQLKQDAGDIDYVEFRFSEPSIKLKGK